MSEKCPICKKDDMNKEAGPFGSCGPTPESHVWMRYLWTSAGSTHEGARDPLYSRQPHHEAVVTVQVAQEMNRIAELIQSGAKESDVREVTYRFMSELPFILGMMVSQAFEAGAAHGKDVVRA